MFLVKELFFKIKSFVSSTLDEILYDVSETLEKAQNKSLKH